MLRRFHLLRVEDVGGKSGTGLVGEGVQFSDGRCAFRWCHAVASTVAFDSVEDLLFVHSHEGRTRLDFIDNELAQVAAVAA